MRLSYTKWIGSLLAAAVVLSGCKTEITKRPEGELGIEHLNGGVVVTDREATYDFGTVFRGQRKNDLSIVITNLGTASLTLASIELQDGDAVEFGAPPADPAAVTATYYVEYTPDTEIEPAGTLVVPVTFIPPADPANSASKDHIAKLLVRVGGTSEEGSTGTINLVGRGVSGQCEIRPVGHPANEPFNGLVDFGTVGRNETSTVVLEIQNPAAIDARANVGEIRSGSTDRLAFEYGLGTPRGTVIIPATPSGQEVSKKLIHIEFQPSEAKNYLALADIQAAEECPIVPLRLTGVGADQVLTWDPQSVDFGAVTPGVQVTRQVTFTNLGNKDATLSEINFPNRPNEFKVLADAGQDPRTLVVPGKGGTAVLTLAAKPGSLGNKNDTMTFKTNLNRQANASINVKVFGGGPDIDVKPSPLLNFGKVAFFSGSPNTKQTRNLLIENKGTRPITGGRETNLLLGEAATDFRGEWVTIVEANAETIPGEFTVEKTAYDPETGLIAEAGKNATVLKIHFAPQSIGTKAATVTIKSNDPDEPVVTINVTAESLLLNPCNFTVAPDPRADFGLVAPGDYRDVAVNVTNNATGNSAQDVCLISGISIPETGGNVFSLAYGAVVESVEILPGETYSILVRAKPTGNAGQAVTEVFGKLEFFMSVETNPRREIELKAAVSQACLSIAPDDWNFGTVEVGCRSSSKAFNIYNSCAAPVVLKNVKVQNGGGNTACPSNALGCEFEISQAPSPAIPASGVTLNSGGSNVTFRARYLPGDFNSDTGAIAVEAEQYGQPVTYLITLRGKGDTQGYNEDTFSQDGQPKSDILVVMDNSGSMGFAQDRIAENFEFFVDYATDQGVDYHLGVVSSDMDDAAESGKLWRTNQGRRPGCPLTPSRAVLWVDPSMSNAAEEFECALPGTNGSATEEMLEAGYHALTTHMAPGAYNHGFLRDEAKLSIVIVTDAKDQSPRPATFYLSQFMNIKGFNRASDLSIHALAGFAVPGTCSYDSGPDDGKFAYLVRQTSGVRDEICTTDWKKALEDIGRGAFGFRTTFFLTAFPDQANGVIQVFLDGDEVPKVLDGSTVWAYDPIQNAVVFDANFAPQAGDALTVTYTVSCNPS